jgi:hypothetical protein
VRPCLKKKEGREGKEEKGGEGRGGEGRKYK